MNVIETFQKGSIIAKVYNRGDGYRVCVFNCYFETQKEKFFDELEEATKYAKSVTL